MDEQDRPIGKYWGLSLYSSQVLTIAVCVVVGLAIVEYGSRVIRPGVAENLGAELLWEAAKLMFTSVLVMRGRIER